MEDQTQKNNKGKFNLYKLLQNVAVIGWFLVVGLCTMFFSKMLPFKLGVVEFTICVGLALIGVLMVLPWAKYMEQKEYKIVSLVFLIATGVCVLLWEIATLIICHAIRVNNMSLGLAHLVRITLLISMQVTIANFIGKYIIKYRNKYIPFQAITYLSLVYIDIWLSILLFGVSINNGFQITPETMGIVWNRIAGSLMILACVYVAVATGVITNARKRRVRNAILAHNRKLNKDIGIMDMDDEDDEENEAEFKRIAKQQADTVEAQLEKLKSMLEKGLITQEEYDAKRKDILAKM